MSCFIGYCQTTEPTSSTGSKVQESFVIPADIIRDANAAIIERNYLRSITKQQDSIIVLKNDIIAGQYKVIDNMQGRIVRVTNTHNNLVSKYKVERQRNTIYKAVTGSAIVGVIISILIR